MVLFNMPSANFRFEPLVSLPIVQHKEYLLMIQTTSFFFNYAKLEIFPCEMFFSCLVMRISVNVAKTI